MQATTTGRFNPQQLKQAALAIAILTSAAIGVTTASIIRDGTDSDSGRAVVASAPAVRQPAFGYQELEQNLDLPTSGAVRGTSDYADYQFIEQNLHLPTRDIVPATDSALDYRDLELNLYLPGTVSSVAPDWRLADHNSRGMGFVAGDTASHVSHLRATGTQRFPIGFSR